VAPLANEQLGVICRSRND